jgi:Xaa-Pro dipeptidase
MKNSNEIRIKEEKVRKFLTEQNLDAYLISRYNNFAWFTAGKDNHVVSSAEQGVASILITADKKYLLTDNIESGRIKEEELKEQGFVFSDFYWYEDFKKSEIIKNICGNSRLGADTDFPGTALTPMNELQHPLIDEEIERYKWLGKESSRCMGKVCRNVKIGQTEFEVASMLSSELLSSGINPMVLLIAADERIFKYRHPIPTKNKIKKYLMSVICAEKWGLIISLTRFVHFGKLPQEIKKKHESVVKVDATYILNSKPGMKISDVLNKSKNMYAETGYAEEWKLHHQGGPTGYSPREYKANSETHEILTLNRALAWNPSITGTKSEDTIITQKNSPLILTETPNWPMIDIKLDEGKIKRPDILIRSK